MFDHSFKCTAVYKVDVVHLSTIITSIIICLTNIMYRCSHFQLDFKTFDCLSTAKVFPQAMRSTG